MLDIVTEVETFYVLEALRYRVPKSSFLPSIESLRKDVLEAHKKQTDGLFLAIRDYLSSICFGEARHSNSCANVSLILKEDDRPDRKLPTGRNDAISNGTQYYPEDFLPVLKDLFYDYPWDGGYGGDSWGYLAEVALKAWTGEWNKITLIDHVADLRHNNGLAFNKGVIFKVCYGEDSDKLLTFLEMKRYKKLEEWYDMCLPKPVWKLVYRAYNLNIIDEVPLRHNFRNNFFYNIKYRTYTDTNIIEDGYDEIEWGGKEFDYRLDEVRTVTCAYCGSVIPESSAYDIRGRLYCEYCYENEFAECEMCGDMFEYATLIKITTREGDRWICDYCYDNMETVTCANCGRANLLIEEGAAKEINGKYYCQLCAPEIQWQVDNGFEYPRYNVSIDLYNTARQLRLNGGSKYLSCVRCIA